MAKATPKKIMTPKAASNDKSPKILGAQKQKTPKSAAKAPKPSTPQVMPMAAAIKKRKSVATSFQVSDIAEEQTPKKTSSTPAKTPLTGKKQKLSVQTPEVESMTPKKKKQSLAADATEETPTKTKKKSMVAQSETPVASTPNEKKKKKLSVAAATTSKPFKVEKKMKPATGTPVAEAESAVEDKTRKRKKKRSKKSKSGGADQGETPSKMAKVETDEGESPSKKAKVDPDQVQLKSGKGKNKNQERSVYTLYVGNLSFK
jgi:hypothetical protein